MADKRIVDLPALRAVTDDTLIPVYQPGAENPAQRMSGKQFKEFGEGSVSQYAESAANSASSAQSAYEGVKAALDSLPEGDTLIIDDLTTGGTKAALSAEQGKVLNDNKVNKAGDTMADNLGIANASKSELYVNIRPADGGRHSVVGGYDNVALMSVNVAGDYTKSRTLRLYNSKAQSNVQSALRLFDNVNGVSTTYDILHTGNKPSGSYTGNGDATERRITTGGTGNVVAIWGGNQVTILTANGGFNYSQSTAAVTGVPIASGRFNSGTIIIATSAGSVNANGVTYNYQVL